LPERQDSYYGNSAFAVLAAVGEVLPHLPVQIELV